MRTRILLWAGVLAVAASANAVAQSTGRAQASQAVTVTAITDGDTLLVERSGERVRVRVYGVDAPERPQAFGTEAAAYASSILLRQTVTMTTVGLDRNGRIVARLRVDNRDFGEMLVSGGFAWHDTRFAPRDTRLAAGQKAARQARRGLWAAPSPQPPWEFRASVPPVESSAIVAYRGNRNSQVFHAPGCQDYGCRNCTVQLASVDDARSRGFRPHTACVR